MPPVCVAASSGERADENGGLDVGGAAEQVGPGNTRPAGSHRIRPMKSGVTFTPSAPVRSGAGFSIARERLRCSRICARHANGPGEVARRHHCGWQLRCALDTLLDPLLDRRCRRRGGRLLFQVRDRVARSQRQRADIVDPGERGSDPRPLYLLEGNQVTERSVGSEQWGRFLIAIFDEWIRTDVGKVYVQMFDAALASWVGAPASMCMFSETCGSGRFGLAKRDTLPRYCRECTVRFACHGECPKNRFI